MRAVAALLILAIVSPVQAQELPEVPEFKLEDIPVGSDHIVSIQKGDAAPYGGQLFEPNTALRWANYLDQYRVQMELRERVFVQLRDADRTYWEAIVTAEQAAGRSIQKDLGTRLRRVEDTNVKLQQELLRPPPWYTTREFGVVLGVLLSLGGVVVWQSIF